MANECWSGEQGAGSERERERERLNNNPQTASEASTPFLQESICRYEM